MKLPELTETAPVIESVAAACRVCTPEVSIRRLVKVATPATAATVVVPCSDPPPDWIVIVTLTVESAPELTTFPFASSTLTTGCVPNAEPAVAPAGWVVTTSCVAVPGAKVTVPVLVIAEPPIFPLSVTVGGAVVDEVSVSV